jgi:hypothetical protein
VGWDAWVHQGRFRWGIPPAGEAGVGQAAEEGIRLRSALKGHALPVCESGKLRYRDLRQAQDALTLSKHRGATARAFGEQKQRNECRAYCCPFFGGWHLTSQPLRGAEICA